MKWNKLTIRKLTDEEIELYPNYDFMWNGITPDIWEKVLVFNGQDIFIDMWEDLGDEGMGFRDRYVGDIYWMSLPDLPEEVD
ncbi:DUF551 domain-containing protein [Streptococcus pluranimalium]|uniref:hypothetical protein n=1 Tax=Streptococcus pluranimalium TaxID=82348 RepID=UPI0039ED67FC